jgi:hypothetical protein
MTPVWTLQNLKDRENKLLRIIPLQLEALMFCAATVQFLTRVSDVVYVNCAALHIDRITSTNPFKNPECHNVYCSYAKG